MPGVGVWSLSGLYVLTKEEMREQEVLPALPGQLHFLLLLQTGRVVQARGIYVQDTLLTEEMMTTWRCWCIGPRDNLSCHDSPDLSSTNSSEQFWHYHDMDDILQKHQNWVKSALGP